MRPEELGVGVIVTKMKKDMGNQTLQVKCPKKRCSGYAEAYVSSVEGNTEGLCDSCDAQVAFSYELDIFDVRLVK